MKRLLILCLFLIFVLPVTASDKSPSPVVSFYITHSNQFTPFTTNGLATTPTVNGNGSTCSVLLSGYFIASQPLTLSFDVLDNGVSLTSGRGLYSVNLKQSLTLVHFDIPRPTRNGAHHFTFAWKVNAGTVAAIVLPHHFDLWSGSYCY